ncbi:unnamed protein product, partial [Callosobruchus maculatus]
GGGGGGGGSNGGGGGGFTNIHIKQEIQIPQVSSLTSSPDSSPSPIAVALGQAGLVSGAGAGGGGGGGVHQTAHHQPALEIVGVQGGGGAGAGAGGAPSAGGGPSPMLLGAAGTAGDTKLWAANSTTTSPHSLSPKVFQFDSGVPAPTASSVGAKLSPLIRDFIQGIDDREWQNSLYGLLQNQTYNQCEVDLFELMCKVLDQNLFSQVDWARNSIFFKDLKV